MNSEFIKSKFNLSMTFGVIGATIILIGLLLYMGYVWVADIREIGLFQRFMITFFPLLVTPLIVKIELPKIRRLAIDKYGIIVKNPFTGQSKKIKWDELDGYQNIVYVTRGGPLKELILISNDKIVFEASENYYKNYEELRRAITRQLKNLGPVDYNYFQIIKQRIFK